MTPIQRVAILGAGGLGAAYGSRFLRAPGFETQFIARGERADRLQSNGLVVNGEVFAAPVARPNDPDIEPADLIIVALKHHHLAGALPDLARFVGPQTQIISVMNGLDSEEMIGELAGAETVLYALALGIDAVREGNHIEYSAGGKIFFGEARNETISPRVARVQEALQRAAIPYETPADMMHALWRKFMINVGINQGSAVLRATYGIFQTDPAAQEIMESLMREAIMVAQAEGVMLTEADLESWYAFLNTLSPAGKTSMLQDIEAGRKTEVEIFGGKVVALGEKHHIATPVNRTVFNAIRVLERYPH